MAILNSTGGYALHIDMIGQDCTRYYAYTMSYWCDEKPVLNDAAINHTRTEKRLGIKHGTNIIEYDATSLISFFERMVEKTEPAMETWTDGADEEQHSITICIGQELPFVRPTLPPEDIRKNHVWLTEWERMAKEDLKDRVYVIASTDIYGSHNEPKEANA